MNLGVLGGKKGRKWAKIDFWQNKKWNTKLTLRKSLRSVENGPERNQKKIIIRTRHGKETCTLAKCYIYKYITCNISQFYVLVYAYILHIQLHKIVKCYKLCTCIYNY